MPQWSESRSCEEVGIIMGRYSRKSNVDIINEEVKGSSSEVEEIKILKCKRKVDNDIISD